MKDTRAGIPGGTDTVTVSIHGHRRGHARATFRQDPGAATSDTAPRAAVNQGPDPAG